MAERKLLEKDWKKQAEQLLYSDHPGITATKFLLAFIGIGGIAVAGAVAPGLLRLIKTFPKKKYTEAVYTRERMSNSLAYLKKRKLIEVLKEKDGKWTVRLTNKGQKRVVQYSLDSLGIKKPAHWDGKWRILMFDIPSQPNRYNQAREALRRKIKELGFHQVQKSAWAYPYECEDELLFLAEVFQVEQYIEILVVEKLLHEDVLRKKFPRLRQQKY